MHVDWATVGKHLAAGGVLFYGVMKFFDAVGDRLNEDTRLGIALWLLGVKTAERVRKWPDHFARMCDRVFGDRYVSWRSFLVSSFITGFWVVTAWAWGTITGAIAYPLWNDTTILPTMDPSTLLLVRSMSASPIVMLSAHISGIFLVALLFSILPSYLALIETRLLLSLMVKSGHLWQIILLFLCYLILTAIIGSLGIVVNIVIAGLILGGVTLVSPWRVFMDFIRSGYWGVAIFVAAPSFFTGVWLWLYLGSGFLFGMARRLDLGFQWFTSHMDIERKPLQCVGLASGAITAIVYWGAALTIHLL